jgi:hypothetical protein
VPTPTLKEISAFELYTSKRAEHTTVSVTNGVGVQARGGATLDNTGAEHVKLRKGVDDEENDDCLALLRIAVRSSGNGRVVLIFDRRRSSKCGDRGMLLVEVEALGGALTCPRAPRLNARSTSSRLSKTLHVSGPPISF